MVRKSRPSILDDLDLEESAKVTQLPKPQARNRKKPAAGPDDQKAVLKKAAALREKQIKQAGEARAAREEAKPVAKAPAPKVKSSVYLPPEVHQKLREIAFIRYCKIHDLIMEGLDHVLVEHGHPTAAELTKEEQP